MRLFRSRIRPERREVAPAWADDAPSGGVRVLVEHPDPTVRDVAVRDLTAAGYDVLACAGPRPEGSGAVTCPLLHQQGCAAVAGADVIVNGLPLDQDASRLILRRILRDRPDTPVIVETSGQTAERHAAGAMVRRLYPLRVPELLGALREVTGGR